MACLFAAEFVARAQPQPGSQNARLTPEQIRSRPHITNFVANKTDRYGVGLAFGQTEDYSRHCVAD